MIRPPPRRRMCGITARESRTTLISTESIASRQSSSVSDAKSADFGPPVLVIRMSIAPSSPGRLLDEPLDVGGARNVGDDRHARTRRSRRWISAAAARAVRLGSGADRHPRPFARERQRRGAAEALARGAHDRALALKFEVHRSFAVEVGVGAVQPVLADRAEQVQLEGVVERLGLVLHPGRDVQHLSLADGDLLAADQELQRPLQHVGHLLALVRVHGHQRPLFQVDLREHLALAGHDLARDHFGDFVELDLVPAMELGRLAHESCFLSAVEGRNIM